MHHSRVMAGAMTLLLLSAPALGAQRRKRQRRCQRRNRLKGSLSPKALPPRGIWFGGPDNHIWVSERERSRIISVDPKTGEKKLVGSIPDVKVGPQHEGVLGIALDPDLGKNGSKNNVYIAHTYMDGGREHARIVRFHYDPQTRKIADPKVILSNMPAGDDHNGGRLRFGPDGKLYYSIGGAGAQSGRERLQAHRRPAYSHQGRTRRGRSFRLCGQGTAPQSRRRHPGRQPGHQRRQEPRVHLRPS